MIERFCQVCGKRFFVYPCYLRDNHKSIFCSRECQAKGRVGTHQSPESSLLKSKALSQKVKRVCQQCGNQFSVKPNVARKGEGKFCSYKCYGEARKGKMVPWNRGIAWPEEIKLKIATTSKRTRYNQWQDDSFVKKVMSGRKIKPNKIERQLEDILNRNFPNTYKYTGDGSLVVNGIIPDFANCNGRKEVIELFGDYWHLGNVRWNYTELGRVMAYNALGFKCFVIWQHELRELTEEEIVDRISTFFGRRPSHVATAPL